MRSPHGLLAASALIAFLVLTNAAYAALVTTFGYDDILREPVGTVLERFRAGGPGLVLAWTAFAWSALVFILAAVLTARAFAECHGQLVWISTAAGAASGLIQAMGLLRWVFVVPTLAAAYPQASEVERAAIAQTYNALNQYGGVALGEHLGQALLVAWSLGIIAASWRIGGPVKWASLIGLASIPLWVAGQTGAFATVLPTLRVLEVTPLAFMFWMVWLLALAVALIVQRPTADSAVVRQEG